MEHGSRTRLVTAVVLAVVFASGVLLGLAADSNLSTEPTEVVATNSEGEEPEGERRRRYIYEQVEPTAEQQVVIDSMMKVYIGSRESLQEELRKGYRELRSSYDPRYQILGEGIRSSIKDVFSEEQAAEYQTLLDDFDRRRTERNENEQDGRDDWD
jgi:hypothetical protein